MKLRSALICCSIWFAWTASAVWSESDRPDGQMPPLPGGDANATRMTDIHDIKPAVSFGADLQWLYWALAAAILLALAVLAWRLWRKRRKPVGPEMAAAPICAETEANRMLDALAADGNLTSKQFYFQLSAILRRYIERRYAIPAVEMTTEELLPAVDRLPLSPELVQPLKGFCRKADPIKFAGAAADPNRMAHDLVFARNFVHLTTETVKSAVDEEEHPSETAVTKALKRLPLKNTNVSTKRRISD